MANGSSWKNDDLSCLTILCQITNHLLIRYRTLRVMKILTKTHALEVLEYVFIKKYHNKAIIRKKNNRSFVLKIATSPQDGELE